MNKQQIRLLARKLMEGESIEIDGETYQAISLEAMPECGLCDLCGIHCPVFSVLSYVCCELDQASGGFWHLVKVEKVHGTNVLQ